MEAPASAWTSRARHRRRYGPELSAALKPCRKCAERPMAAWPIAARRGSYSLLLMGVTFVLPKRLPATRSRTVGELEPGHPGAAAHRAAQRQSKPGDRRRIFALSRQAPPSELTHRTRGCRAHLPRWQPRAGVRRWRAPADAAVSRIRDGSREPQGSNLAWRSARQIASTGPRAVVRPGASPRNWRPVTTNRDRAGPLPRPRRSRRALLAARQLVRVFSGAWPLFSGAAPHFGKRRRSDAVHQFEDLLTEVFLMRACSGECRGKCARRYSIWSASTRRPSGKCTPRKSA
jgi:hypothetical protein